MAAAGLVSAVNFATIEYGLAGSAGRRHLPAAEYAWVQQWIWVPLIALITVYLFLLFPTGTCPRRGGGRLAGRRLRDHRDRRAGVLPGPDRPDLPGLRNPLGVTPAAAPFGAVVAGLAGLLGCAVLAAWSLAVRSRRGTAVQRHQIKWLAYSGCLVALALAPAAALSLTPGTPARIAAGAAFAAVLAVPTAVAVAVLKYRLYDIDRVISRTLGYAIVTGLLVGVYAGLVLLATQVLGLHTPVAVAAATLAAAALFSPIRLRVQRMVDRRFNRARYDAEATVAAFAARLKDAVDLDTVRDDLASMVQTALEPAHLRVWTSQRD